MSFTQQLKLFMSKVGASRRLQSLVFVSVFALIGVTFLIISLAASPPSRSNIFLILPKSGTDVTGQVVVDANFVGATKNDVGILKVDGQPLPGKLVATIYGFVYRNPNGDYHTNFADFGVGPHSLTATFRGVESAPVTINNTTQVKIVQPTNNASVGPRVSVAASLSLSSPKPFSSVKLRVDGVDQTGSFVQSPYGWVYKDGSGQWGANLALGLHKLEVDADSIISEPVNIGVNPPPPNGPTVSIIAPNDGANVTNPFTVSASIDDPSVPTSLVIDGQTQAGSFQPTGLGWLFTNQNGSYNINLPTGRHSLKLVNGSNSSSTININVGNAISGQGNGGGGLTNGSRLGIAAGSPYNTTTGNYNDNQYYDKIKSLGLTWVRTDVHPCSYSNMTAGDAIVNQARRTGLKVIITIDYAFCGLGENSWNSAPRDRAAYANYSGNLAAHWNQIAPGTVGAIEVWNEPNNPQFWSPVDPAKYTDLLRKSYAAIKSKVPNMLVIAGGTADIGGNTSASGTGNQENPATFYQVIYNNNGGNSNGLFDAAAHHPYTSHSKVVNLSGAGYRETFFVRKVLDAHGDASKQIWGTEAGWTSCYITFGGTLNETDRAARLKGDLKDWFYGLHDPNNGQTIGYGRTSDWNTGPYMIFRLYKNTNGPDPGFGLIYDNNRCDGGQANYPGTYEPPAITELKNIASLPMTTIPQ